LKDFTEFMVVACRKGLLIEESAISRASFHTSLEALVGSLEENKNNHFYISKTSYNYIEKIL